MSDITKRQPGRPKDNSIHTSAIQAVLEIMGEKGFDSVTLKEVAERAKISRPTLYRRWKKKEELIAEALESQRSEATIPNSGSLRGDLQEAAQDFMDRFNTPLGRQAIIDIVKANIQHKPSAQAWGATYGAQRQNAFKIIFTRAIDRGEIAADADIETMMFILSAALMQGCLLENAIARPPLTSKLDTVISFVLRP